MLGEVDGGPGSRVAVDGASARGRRGGTARTIDRVGMTAGLPLAMGGRLSVGRKRARRGWPVIRNWKNLGPCAG